MEIEIIALFFKLIIGHFIADYPLQGDFLAKAKNHQMPIPGVPFYQALIAHAAIHAGVVWYITGSGLLAMIEFFLHGYIDFLKCNNELSFNQDQIAHFACKAFYVLLIWSGMI